jgi:hypothetical protein
MPLLHDNMMRERRANACAVFGRWFQRSRVCRSLGATTNLALGRPLCMLLLLLTTTRDVGSQHNIHIIYETEH